MRPYSRTQLAESHSHYPTRMLDGSTVVKSTGSDRIVVPRPHMGVVNGALAGAILKAVYGPTSIGDLVSEIDSDQVTTHVAWLLKQGYLEVVS